VELREGSPILGNSDCEGLSRARQFSSKICTLQDYPDVLKVTHDFSRFVYLLFVIIGGGTFITGGGDGVVKVTNSG
jgi:hypothetical protein